ncbi:MAG: FkbM family methyltransferase, partial [Gammaproteobacteria bacterium]
MTFISYAQNYEDVMLHRALKDVEKGFYIDVGANDPVTDSVTKAFYDAGWRGINIEPVSEWYEKLKQDRPEDINLQSAVGADQGEIAFYEVVGTGLSTANESIAKRHAKDSGYEIQQYKVPQVTLASICDQHSHTDIHFLKIDVEGAEKSVLQGMNLQETRPWIVLIESTLPN